MKFVLFHALVSVKTNVTVAEYGEFLHKNGHKYHNFEDIKKEIENETERYFDLYPTISIDYLC